MVSLQKTRYGKTAVCILFVTVLFLTILGNGVNAASFTQATGTLKNHVINSSFEDSSNLTTDVNNRNGTWVTYLSSVAAGVGRDESRAAVVSSVGASLEQDIVDLKPNTEYAIKVWAKTTAPTAKFYIGVKNFGSTQSTLLVDSTEYKQYQVKFTTGASNTSARVFFWKESGGGTGYVDDYEVKQSTVLESVIVREEGTMEISFNNIPAAVAADAFAASYTTSLDPDQTNTITLTNFNFNAATSKVTYNYPPIAAAPLAQQITMAVEYKQDRGQVEVLFDLPANGEQVIEPVVEEMSVSNGNIEIILAENPTYAPKLSDFGVNYTVNSGAESLVLPIQSLQYSAADKKVDLAFNGFSKEAAQKTIHIQVTLKGVETAGDLVIEALGIGITYYVDDVNGNDLNDGTSPEHAWQSIEKVNNTTFSGNDKLLFKAGGNWTGELWPKGSGVEGKPIIVDKYGEGPKPRFMAGADTTIPYMTWVQRSIENVKVNNGLKLSNQSYWEINNLELFDPSYDSVSPNHTNVYRRGVFIHAEDVGEIKHIYLNNLYIHGFRGPSYNEGKVSGGIIAHVFTSKDASKRKKTWFDDLKITNNKIEKVGRSGVNFHTPWTTRKAEDGKWANFSYVGVGEWTPFTNVYIGHNIFKEIDGDGTIIDNTLGAVFEHNLVDKALNNSGYAAGVFSWNSTDTVIQFNELSNTGRGNDAQGVEIDALNDNTIVQYNYSHDNFGGFLEWCTIPGYPSYDGIFRYNISQNDGTGYGVIALFTNNFGSKAYNNTIYLAPGLDRTVFSRKSGGYNNKIQFFNNIVYNAGGLKDSLFHEDVVEYSNNIFYGFPSAPQGSITADPKLVAIGTGGSYSAEVDVFSTLTGYNLLPDSPAIDAGVNVENNGGRDILNNPLYNGLADIGAVEYYEEEEQEPEPTTLFIKGPTIVNANEHFQVKLGFKYLDKPILAEQIVLQYDQSKFDFVEAISLVEGVRILDVVNEAGQIKLLVISEGSAHAVSDDKEMVELEFTAKSGEANAAGVIAATEAVVADANGEEWEATLASISISINSGTSGDLNNDGKISIGDLAMIAANYGKNEESSDWAQVNRFDLDANGSIDINDLAIVASKIVLEP
ncbi:MAG: carbohydrate binding domain-containing protein [Candidatus Pristimantibacillus sp.]